MNRWVEVILVALVVVAILTAIGYLGTKAHGQSWVTKPMKDLTRAEIEEAKPYVVEQYKYCQDGRLTDAKCMTFVIRMNLLCAVDSIGQPGKWVSVCNALSS